MKPLQFVSIFITVVIIKITSANVIQDGIGVKSEMLQDRFRSTFEIITNTVEYQANNQLITIEDLLEKNESEKRDNDNRDLLLYTLGQREYGDQLVAHGLDRVTFLSPRDFRQVFEYPTSGIGAILTHVSIVVEQDNTFGRAYVVGGGIGERYIAVAVEGYQTTVFGYELNIYGGY